MKPSSILDWIFYLFLVLVGSFCKPKPVNMLVLISNDYYTSGIGVSLSYNSLEDGSNGTEKLIYVLLV